MPNRAPKPPVPSSASRTSLPIVPVSTIDTRAGRTVLVVEDDEATRRLIVRALRTTYTVYEAPDGESASDLLERLDPVDCVVSDIAMPRLPGTALAQRMRNHPRLKSVPIIFVTAKGQPGDVVEGINAGARHYISKPFKLKDLLEKVASVIPKQ